MEMTATAIDAEAAVAALGALAQEHRLAVFRLLVQAGPDGLPAGAIAQRLGLPNSSLSFHLAQLSRTGLVTQERRHRTILYRTSYAAIDALVAYLMENCCGGEARCAPSFTLVSEREDA
jgi:DNA-binding transcriptional ArsR family regulator